MRTPQPLSRSLADSAASKVNSNFMASAMRDHAGQSAQSFHSIISRRYNRPEAMFSLVGWHCG